jgi:TolB-like protein/class 3 adenylate cyclase/Flp pilus assembly protein TadD
MSAEVKKEIQLEIAYVLFIDLVGYSKLLVNEQRSRLEMLNEIVRGTDEFRSAEANGRLLTIATGDGMALVFYQSPEAPVECALEVSRALQKHPELQLRMGVHSGPVSGVVDVTGRANVAGAGINMAQRVMDCGDAGHILLSKHVAEDLEQYGHWNPHLHDLGECEVKHGARVHVINLYTPDLGNPSVPEKLKASHRVAAKTKVTQWATISVAILLLGTLALAFVMFRAAAERKRTASQMGNHALPIPAKSIAVLPFQSLSKDEENAFFADGVQDEILTDLAKIADLKVISRTSVMPYKNVAARNLREIAQQLGVAHVLEGSVQRVAQRVRINAQLIDARTDAHVWGNTYDRELADVFAIQSEIAQAIAQQLQARLSPIEKAAIAKAPTKDVIANDLFIRAKKLGDLAVDPAAKPSLLEAVRLLQEAVARDPQFLLAYCLLARTHMDLYWGGFDHSDARRELANSVLQIAERIQPGAGEIHQVRADYFYHGFRDYEQARRELDLARQTLPNEASVYFQIGAIDRRQARWEEAIRNFNRAIELDPRNLVIAEEAGFTNVGTRRFVEGRRLLELALSISPKDYFVRTNLGMVTFFERGDTALWREQLSKIEKEGVDAAQHVTFFLVLCSLAERDHAAAEHALSLIRVEGLIDPFNNVLVPREWFAGLVARSFGDNVAAQTSFTAARTILERMVIDQPDYAPAWSLLGVTDAALGRGEEAIKEGRRACEILPLSKDAWEGPSWVINLAMIYGWLGAKDAAFEQLEAAVKNTAGVSYGELKLMPMWDPLRKDPRFDQALASLQPKEEKK